MSSAVNEPVPRAPASRFPARPVRGVLARAEVRLLPEGVPGERWPHKSTQQVFCERRPWPGACGLWRLLRCPHGNMASKRGNEDAGPAGGSRRPPHESARPPRRLLPAKASSRRDGISLGEGWGESPLSSTDTKMSAYDVICVPTTSYADARLVHSIKMPKITFLVNKRISPSFSSNCRALRARGPFFLTSHHPLGVLRILVYSGRAGTGRLTNTCLVLTVLEAEDTGVWWGSPDRPGSEGAGSTLLPGHSSNVWGLQPVTQSPPQSPTS